MNDGEDRSGRRMDLLANGAAANALTGIIAAIK